MLLYETWFIILMLILCPPFGIVIMSRNSFWESKTQIFVAIASIVVFAGIVLGIIFAPDILSSINQIKKSHTRETQPIETVQEETVYAVETTTPSTNTAEERDKDVTGQPSTTDYEIKATGDYLLTSEQIDELSDSEKYEYLLSKEFNFNNSSYEISVKPVLQSKFDVSVSITEPIDAKMTEIMQLICEKIYALNYKPKTMQVILKIDGKKIATIKDYSSEIVSQIECSVFENGELQKMKISIKAEEKEGE